MKQYYTEIKWGFVFTGVALLWMVFEKLMGWHSSNISSHATMTNLFAIPAIAIYILALLDKRKTDYSGTMSWKQGVVSGLIVTVVIALLSPLAQLITHTIISPEYFPNITKHTAETSQFTQEEAAAYFNLKNYILQSIIGALIMGVATSAVIAILTRKKTL